METLIQPWLAQAAQYFQAGDYGHAAALYEQGIETEPEQLSHYWSLGLAYLLQENEAEAQTTWLYALSQGDETQQSEWLADLIGVLVAEATQQQSNAQPKHAWLIRQHVRALEPDNLVNLLELISLAIELEEFDPAYFDDWGITFLVQAPQTKVEPDPLLKVLEQTLLFLGPPTLEFAKACLTHVQESPNWLNLYIKIIEKTGNEFGRARRAIELVQLCLGFLPEHLDLWSLLARFQLKVEDYQDAIQSARKVLDLSQEPIQKAVARADLLKNLITAGNWSEVEQLLANFRQDLDGLLELPEIRFDSGLLQALLVKIGTFAYLQDNLPENRHYQNLLADLFLQGVQTALASAPEATQPTHLPVPRASASETRKLKIGYIGSTFRRHSVSWLNRWLFAHHNKKEFEIHIYSFGEVIEDPFFKAWFEPQAHFITESRNKTGAMIRKIQSDEIDILVDLDSYTLDLTCTVMAAKPAPIQVTWLGTDASGLKSIDYFIADPYVLPEYAQEHYQEKIWRLPQTYLAVDGFEVGYPTIHREDLDIPLDAVVYFSSQGAYKRHPETMRLQLEIIKQVPNSYLLVKGVGDPEIIKAYFTDLAKDVGVSIDQLRFLESFATEYDHRANLQIADVILDTYPYSGATTTLEALWVGVPLVTRVGETFSSRNSFTFLKNVGVEEGIAWTAEEYVEWGVRFGTDEALRQDVAWKLYQSRHTSPLWDAKQFTLEMEAAYKQMWAQYCATCS